MGKGKIPQFKGKQQDNSIRNNLFNFQNNINNE